MQDKIDAILRTVASTASDLYLDRVNPNASLITEIFQLDATQLSEVDDHRLSQYILVMGQYLVMLQYQENLKNIQYTLSQKAFDIAYSKERFVREDIKTKTDKATKDFLLSTSEYLLVLDAMVLEASAEKMLLNNMVGACSELLNALKKEKSGRDGGRYGQSY